METDEFESAKKGKKQSKRLSVSIRAEVYDALKVYVDANGYDTSKLVEKVIEKFLQTRG